MLILQKRKFDLKTIVYLAAAKKLHFASSLLRTLPPLSMTLKLKVSSTIECDVLISDKIVVLVCLVINYLDLILFLFIYITYQSGSIPPSGMTRIKARIGLFHVCIDDS